MRNFDKYDSTVKYDSFMQLTDAMYHGSDLDIDSALRRLLDMTNGVCFCYAHGASDCVCGAWHFDDTDEE